MSLGENDPLWFDARSGSFLCREDCIRPETYRFSRIGAEKVAGKYIYCRLKSGNNRMIRNFHGHSLAFDWGNDQSQGAPHVGQNSDPRAGIDAVVLHFQIESWCRQRRHFGGWKRTPRRGVEDLGRFRTESGQPGQGWARTEVAGRASGRHSRDSLCVGRSRNNQRGRQRPAGVQSECAFLGRCDKLLLECQNTNGGSRGCNGDHQSGRGRRGSQHPANHRRRRGTRIAAGYLEFAGAQGRIRAVSCGLEGPGSQVCHARVVARREIRGMGALGSAIHARAGRLVRSRHVPGRQRRNTTIRSSTSAIRRNTVTRTSPTTGSSTNGSPKN